MTIPKKNHEQQIQAALYRISEAAQASQDLGELYHLIHVVIAELMPAENFYIAMFDAGANLLSFPYYADEFDETPTPYQPGKGLTEYVLRSGQPLLATPEVYEQLVENGDVELIGADSVDWLGVPLKTLTYTIGMMAIQTYNLKVRYSQADQDILVFISNQVAMAIERKRVEESLRANEQRYRMLFEHAPVGILLVTPLGRIVDVNPAALHILGSPSAEATKAINVLTFPPLIVAGISADIQRCFETAQEMVFEHSYTSKWGKTSYIQFYLTPILDEVRRVSQLQIMIEDISELKQAERERAQRLVELEAVNHLSRAFRASQNLDEMLPRLLDETLHLMNTQAGAIWLYDAASGELHAQAAQGWYQQLSALPIIPGEGAGGQVFVTGQPYFSAEIASDPNTRQSIRPQIPGGWSGVCVPIQTAAETIGIFYLAVPLPRIFTPEEVRLLTTLVEIAGNAIHRMQLHAETELHVQRLSALRTIDMTITASLDLRVTLDVLLEQVISQLKADAADVLLLNEHTQTLEYIAGRGFHSSSPARSRQRLGEAYAGRVALERRPISITHPDMLMNAPSQAFRLSMEDFKTYQGVPLIAKGKVKGVLEVFHHKVYKPDLEWLDFLETLAGQAAIAIDDAQLFDYLQRMNTELMVAYDSTIEGWSRALELRDQETEGHTRRVAEMTMELARAMQVFTEENLIHVRRGALLHDIGKMGVPDEILLKPSPLTEDEWAIMHKHPQYAYDLLLPISYLRPSLDIPYYHHEWWDGSGYPHGLAGEKIPLGARIFAVVDVWDALTTDRPYGKAWQPEVAKEYIHTHSGTQFDPEVVAVFLRLLDAGTLQISSGRL